MHPLAKAANGDETPVVPPNDTRAVKIFARTLFNDMIANGLSHDQILALAANLIARVTEDMKEAHPTKGRA